MKKALNRHRTLAFQKMPNDHCIKAPGIGCCDRLALLGPIGVYIYVIGFALPYTGSIPLMVLVVTSILAAVFGTQVEHVPDTSLPFKLVAIFLTAMGLSLLVSDDIGRSLRFSASFLPATLLFLLIAERFQGARNIRFLYLSFSILGLGLATLLLWSAWKTSDTYQNAWVAYSGSPILITRNDLAFLSVITPFSLVLVYREPRSVVGAIAALSTVFSVAAVIVFQSRGATLALFFAVFCTVALLRTRFIVATTAVLFIVMLIIDGALGFPLIGRFMDLISHPSAGRSDYWATAWKMFLDAPLLGHGPHTFALFHKDPWTHNLYLQVLAEQGFIGLVTLLALLAWGLSKASKTRHAKSDDIRLYGAGAFGSLLGFCFSSMVELSFLRHWVVIMLFILIGVITRLSSLQINGESQ